MKGSSIGVDSKDYQVFQCLNAKFDIGATSETNVLTGNESFVWRWDMLNVILSFNEEIFQWKE